MYLHIIPTTSIIWKGYKTEKGLLEFLAKCVECLPMVQETWVQSQVVSYQRLQKWYLIPPCLTLSIIRYVSRVKWSNPWKRVAPSPTPRCSSYWKGSLLVALDYGRQLYFTSHVASIFQWRGERQHPSTERRQNRLIFLVERTETKENRRDSSIQ